MSPEFDETDSAPSRGEELVLDLDGFEGPIDLLLTLAREQKVDLAGISILELADQYLVFIAAARRVRLELAADYLVMATWLAYLKSRLLLPEPESEEPSGEELAAALAFQLQRLEAMRRVGERLMDRPRLGRDVFARGAPEGVTVLHRSIYETSLYDLLRAYADHRRRREGGGALRIAPLDLYSLDEALQRLADMIGRLPNWATLASFVPEAPGGSLRGRSALAATFAASLELAKAGRIDLRQDRTFGPIYLRRVPERGRGSEEGR